MKLAHAAFHFTPKQRGEEKLQSRRKTLSLERKISKSDSFLSPAITSSLRFDSFSLKDRLVSTKSYIGRLLHISTPPRRSLAVFVALSSASLSRLARRSELGLPELSALDQVTTVSSFSLCPTPQALCTP